MGTADFPVLFKALAELQLSADEVACLQDFCASVVQPGGCFALIEEAASNIQGVNGWHGRFKTWLRRFNGVASRYLHHYAAWQQVLDTGVLTAPRQWLYTAVAGR